MSRKALLWALWSVLFVLPAPPPLQAEESKTWQAGAFLDLSYGLNFNFPENHRWRSKDTTNRTNEWAPNMGYAYFEKDPTHESRWGVEVAAQAGYDTDSLVPTEQPMGGADALRHLARANVSYLAPIGSGMTVTAGIFRGFKNYESYYAKNNFNYTRAYITDFNPNFMMGLGAEYDVTEAMEVGFYVLNEYQYLAHANNLPSYAAAMEWRTTKHLTLYQNLYYGPDQRLTAMKYWRAFSDSTVEWRGEEWTFALSYDVGTERLADQPGAPRAFWMGSALFTQWNLTGPWSVAVRPEFFWDRNGRMTQHEQLIWANTSTLEYKRHVGTQEAILRVEHRYDHSTGEEGGFFTNGLTAAGQPKLTAGQHLLWLSIIWAFDL
jgi:hypothetical protein